MADEHDYDKFEVDDQEVGDAFEPLEVIPLPVPIDAYDSEAGAATSVRLFFEAVPGVRDPWPGGDLSDVVVLQAWDRVAIGLVRRIVHGDGPNNLAYGAELMIHGKPVSVDIALSEPLGTRPLVDAATGEVVPRVERETDDPLPGEVLGTPLWRPY